MQQATQKERQEFIDLSLDAVPKAPLLPEMAEALRLTLMTLNGMTTKEFSRGADRGMRARIEAVLAKYDAQEGE
jgi:hypothetical protein